MRVKLVDIERVDKVTSIAALFTLGKYYEVREDGYYYDVVSDNGYYQCIPKECFVEVEDYIIF